MEDSKEIVEKRPYVGATKLDQDQRTLALRMHAEGMSLPEIKKEIKTLYGITITTPSLHRTCKSKKHQPTIESFRNAYLSQVKTVPIANKRYRINDFEKERVRIKSLIDTVPTKTASNKLLYISLVSELRKILESAREEMERKPHLFQNVNVQMGEMNDAALHERKQHLMRRIRRSDGGGIIRDTPDPTGGREEDT